jgi:hypothetical protein
MPLTIGFTGKSFRHPYAALNGSSSITVDWLRMLWAATTVGRANYADVFAHGKFSWYQFYARTLALVAYVKEVHGIPVRTAAYKGLDPSEKCGVSYFLGMAMAKLMASTHFNVHWPMHHDIYKPGFSITYAGTRRPDLIGVNRKLKWAVIEAKGRSNGSSLKFASGQKKQLRGIKTINRTTPFIKFVSVSHFANDKLKAFLVDPDDYDDGAIDLEIPRGPDFFRLYYQEIRNAVEYGPRDGWRGASGLLDFEGIWFSDAEIGFGIHKRVLDDWDTVRLADTATAMPYYKPGVKVAATQYIEPTETYCGPDGIAVVVGPRLWQASAEAKPPTPE